MLVVTVMADSALSCDLLQRLCTAGLVGPDSAARLTPLAGGVSSDIYLVTAGARQFVVKSALPRLRVADTWFADVSRNAVERDYLAYAAPIVPDAVPRILGGNPAEGWFAMEFLGDGFRTWKAHLLVADAQPAHARRAGDVLGRLHRASWDDASARHRFATRVNFHALRIEPYLLTAAERVPAGRTALIAEARRLAATQLALVHGDYSPKNLLIGAERLVMLDAECGWFGDPAFDPAFLLTHLFLKALLHARAPAPLLALVPEFWSSYALALGGRADGDLEARTVRLLLCLLLARIHGKSPVEYLISPAQREQVTTFALDHLQRSAERLAPLTDAWGATLPPA